MKLFFTTFAVLSLLAAAPVYAGHDGMASREHNHSNMDHSAHADMPSTSETKELNADCENIVKVKVDGLVCDFCARALEKVFSKHDEVDGIQVDMDKGLVSIAMKAGQTMDDATLTKLISDSGYNVKTIAKGC